MNESELLEQKSRKDERSKGAADSGKLLLEKTFKQEEEFREQAERRRREHVEMQKRQLEKMKKAENELMKKAQALRKETDHGDSHMGSPSSRNDNKTEAESKWKKGFFASLFGRK